MTDHPHVLIVGAGIIGASFAWHLARAGARVTIVEAGEPGGVATRASFAWINANWGNPEPYFRLRLLAMQEWRRFERDVPGIQVAWTGGLIWDLPPDRLQAFAVEHASWGYPVRLVDRAEAQRIEPQLAAPPEIAAHAEGEGALEPLAATQALLAAAQSLGASMVAGRLVQSLTQRQGRVTGVETDGGRLCADEVVLAAGVGTASLAASTGFVLPLCASPNLLLYSQPHGKLLNGLVLAPEMHLRQTRDGRLVAAAALTGDPAEASTEMFARMQQMIRGGDSLVLDHYAVGSRPIPADGLPLIGRPDGTNGLYVAATHSGITLAPTIGRLAAQELLTGDRDRLLSPYGLERFGDAAGPGG